MDVYMDMHEMDAWKGWKEVVIGESGGAEAQRGALPLQ